MKLQSFFRKVLLFSLVVLMVAALFRCANVMAPTGGPKDVTPPKIVEAVPPNHSTGFTGNKFSLTFDEYVQLKEIGKQLLVSPPMLKPPDFRIRKKTLIVRFNEPLKPNTTYSVFFGDAIQDVDEGNPLHNFTYVFSTGKKIDSLSLRGKVVDARDLKPVDGVFVMLYKNDNDTVPFDSLPLRVKPYYLSKTDKNGKFFFNGLADTSYLIFALKDQNYSLTYDQPGEDIAFLDSLVTPQYRPKPHIDTVLLDSLTKGLPSDSAQMISDSLWKVADSLANSKLTPYQLYLFKETPKVQQIEEISLARLNTIRFVFRIPAKNITIHSLHYHPENVWYRSEWTKNRDTLFWYLRIPHPDTLDLLVMNGKDTLENKSLRVVPRRGLTGRKRKHHKKKVVYLSWKANHDGNIKPGEKLVLTFGQPVEKIIDDSILLVQNKDSVWHPAYSFLDDLHRKVYFPMKIKDESSYKLIIPDSSVIDWNGFYNKKIVIVLRAKPLKDYGEINVKVQPKQTGHYIFKLLDAKGNLIAVRYFASPTTLHFVRMNPGKYRFKIIFDTNGNKKWDPGNYLQKKLPEKVIYFGKTIQLRANWDMNETWKF
ncbi:Ig-like domain-containing protein [Candidatus Sulfidibacterium hydrothermale]|uniref:Ig-like domain-containing protein n=1 Tax=Candidatus Sulfidibacterium hydrothermale TaxID=2875962 RepID=UPI001F0B0BBF|nr:Ig-like domain-containing protein [Candidatus Sulfidibacterium hydrothermale]UBM63511.1 Ig-like domain-containing protein [Candidatus Sulfidibacterium hydrothermale]